ncbi:hypothetical protein Q4508_00470 [Amphritea sp. 2_MG-2023]|uniref:hypothetical protein n=1 Tax=Amphritea atlantica TaxID=355243 RepID=UPI001C073C1E|nr:hypothetical protein [Amphritea atlantica]MBU2966184.1 hypothetical protein [Amphritea atlantica]MDO6417028.1 hypothetical protein [Amphritea sp. 2_MG-2023]
MLLFLTALVSLSVLVIIAIRAVIATRVMSCWAELAASSRLRSSMYCPFPVINKVAGISLAYPAVVTEDGISLLLAVNADE